MSPTVLPSNPVSPSMVANPAVAAPGIPTPPDSSPEIDNASLLCKQPNCLEQSNATSSSAPVPPTGTTGSELSKSQKAAVTEGTKALEGVRRSGRERKATTKAREASDPPPSPPKAKVQKVVKFAVASEASSSKRKSESKDEEALAAAPVKKAKTAGTGVETSKPQAPKIKFRLIMGLKLSKASSALKAPASLGAVAAGPRVVAAAAPRPEDVHNFLQSANVSGTTKLYFGYGQDLSSIFMEKRYQGTRVQSLAVLDGYMCTPNSEGIPTIEHRPLKAKPAVLGQVWGFVYSVDDQAVVNEFAGVNGHLGSTAKEEFTLKEVTVSLKGDHKPNGFTMGLDLRLKEEVEKEVQCLTFVDRDHVEGDGRLQAGEWSEEVVKRLNSGIIDAFMHGMSSDYERLVLRKRGGVDLPKNAYGVIW